MMPCPLITAENIAPVLSSVMWPIVALVALLLLRTAIVDALARLAQFKDIKFNPGLTIPASSTAAEVKAEGAKLAKDKVANIYWAGADLMTAFSSALRRGDRSEIVRDLAQANFHIREIGLDGTPVQKRLQKLYDDAAATNTGDWTDQKRLQFAQNVHSIAGELGAIIREAQPGFRDRA